MNRAVPLLAALLALGCHPGLKIDRTYTAKSQDSRAQFLILHFTNEGFEDSVKILTQGKVSSHYLVREEPPAIYQLVDEGRRAYHAGVSTWKGQTMLNAASIGIEIVNDGDRKGPNGLEFKAYSPAQIDRVVALVRDIVTRHQIRPDRVLGHSDIAPMRKVDPGPLFPWKRLADEGLVAWPDAAAVAKQLPRFQATLPEVGWFQKKLAEHGFDLPASGELDARTRTTLAAFQMKYRPARWDGQPDAETAALLEVLTAPEAPKP